MLLCYRSKQSSHGPPDSSSGDDDEHRLIARYTARLAADANNAVSRAYVGSWMAIYAVIVMYIIRLDASVVNNALKL